MARIELTLTFTNPDGTARTQSLSIETPGTTDPRGERRVAHGLFSNLRVIAGEQENPKHNATARRWLDFPKRAIGIQHYFDVRNSQTMWFELSNLVMGAEADLILAQAFKEIEPHQEPTFEDDAAVNDLFFIHDRKMSLLNQAVVALIKVQDLVNRLLHESLGGDLVDTSKPNWETSQLSRANVVKGLEEKYAAGAVTQTDFRAISEALEIPRSIPRGETARTYRNRLAHHPRPSVDYSMFFASLESRIGEEIKDGAG
jgi:hypothetical protein